MAEMPRILLVDDDRAFLEVTAKMLVTAGYAVDCAMDAHEALARLNQDSSYDILIADREMPGNDQLALIRKLPAAYAGIPIIIVTAYPTVDSAIQALKLTVVAYVVKPVAREELLAHVLNALELARARRLLHSSHTRLATWRDELAKLDLAMRVAPGELLDSAREAWFAINLDHIRQTLLEMQAGLAQASPPREPPAPSAEARPAAPFGLRATEQLALLQGLRETIEVLESTKRSFKSRELGELRRKLDALFRTSHAPRSSADKKP